MTVGSVSGRRLAEAGRSSGEDVKREDDFQNLLSELRRNTKKTQQKKHNNSLRVKPCVKPCSFLALVNANV